MKKSLFKIALLGVMAFTGNVNANAIGDLSVEPFEIGPGKVTTVTVHISHADPKIDIVKLWFNLPEGVYIKAIPNLEESYELTTSDYILKNIEKTGALEEAFNYKPGRTNGEYKFSLLTADGKFAFSGDALTQKGVDFLSFDVVCADNVAANPNATIEFMPKTELSCSTLDAAIYTVGDGNLTAPAPKVAVYEKFPATISASGYTSICSTTALDFSGVDGLTAYVVSKAEGGKATLTEVENAPANEGIILKGTAGTTYEIPTGTGTKAENLLTGVTKMSEIKGDGTQFFLVGGKFVKAANPAYLPAGKAYLTASASAKAFDVLEFDFDGDATAIQNVEKEQFDGAIYNLNGVRVDNPTKGVYVKDGKKFVVK